jgi:hypothetical protein
MTNVLSLKASPGPDRRREFITPIGAAEVTWAVRADDVIE